MLISLTLYLTVDPNKPFSWKGAGASVFGHGGTSPGQGEETEDGEIAPSHDIHFEPIVQLAGMYIIHR